MKNHMPQEDSWKAAGDAIPLQISSTQLGLLTPSAVRSAAAELLGILDERSRRIITRRFGLDGRDGKTLHAIGAEEGVTRERIRQIEQSALKTFRAARTSDEADSSRATLKTRDALRELLESLGGVAREPVLWAVLRLQDLKDRAAIRFLLAAFPDVKDVPESDLLFRHFRHQRSANSDAVLTQARALLVAASRLLGNEEFFAGVRERIGMSLSDPALRSVLSLSREIVQTPFGEWGLRGWAEATPRGVGDKAYIVLKRAKRPLHFTALTERINAAKFDRRTAHPQTVHNELIRDSRFVLVGRGLYALMEWGYEAGTVADVLVRILRSARASLSREELVTKVLEKRIVKRNTILLALQNKKRFARHADGTFVLAVSAAGTALEHSGQQDGIPDTTVTPAGERGDARAAAGTEENPGGDA